MAERTLVIIPAYNEEKTIVSLIQSIKNLYPQFDIVVINDGSEDNTVDLAREAGAQVLSHPFNMGYGVALQTGYKFAVHNNYDQLVQIDGDGQHDPKGIKTLLDNLKEGSCDIVLGSRFIGTGDYKHSIFRSIGARFFRMILRLLSGQKISDPTTGFQAMKKNVLQVFVRDVFPCDYPDADVIVLLVKLRYKIREVPVVVYPKKGGKSMHRNPLRVIYYIFKMSLSMFITRIRNDQVAAETL
jgi:glycosyltransferase involved in cell wall biosynthesis